MGSPQVTPTEVVLTLGDGSVVKGANYEEALKVAVKRIEDNQTAYKTEKSAREQAEQRAADAQRELDAMRRPKPVADPSKFDNEKYFALLNSQPIEAQNYLDAHRFGISEPSQVPEVFNSLRNDVTNMNQQAVAAQFITQHVDDFPPDGVAAKKLTERVQHLCMNEGMPLNLRTMNMAYSELVEEQAIKPVEKKTDNDDDKTLPPSLRGSGGGVEDLDVSRFEKMTDKELEAEMRKAGMLR